MLIILVVISSIATGSSSAASALSGGIDNPQRLDVQKILITGDPHFHFGSVENGVFVGKDYPPPHVEKGTFYGYQYKPGGTVLPVPEIGERIANLCSSEGIDFQINLGDMTYDQQYPDVDEFTCFVDKANRPVFVALGDHDGGLTGVLEKELSIPSRSNYYLHENILHIFLCPMVHQSLAGGTTTGLRYFVKYLVEHKYPDRTTFIYSHMGWENMPSWRIHAIFKSANFIDVEWWDNLFRDNPQIKGVFGAHVHQSYLHKNAFMYNGVGYTQSTIHTEPGMFMQTVESFCKGSWAGFLNDGETGQYPVMEIRENEIRIRYWDINEDRFLALEHMINTRTSFDPSTEDEFGYLEVFMDNRKVANWNHFIGKERYIEVVGVPDPNVFPNPEMRESFWWLGGDRGVVAPWLAWSGDLKRVTYDREGHQFIFSNTSGEVCMPEEGKPPFGRRPNFAHTWYAYRDIPEAAEDVDFRLEARIWSGSDYPDGLTLKLTFDRAEWWKSHTLLGSENTTVDLHSGWGTYSFVAHSPSGVVNPDFDAPCLRVLPSLTFNSVGTYRLDKLRIYPVPEGSEDELVNPEVTINGRRYTYSGSLGSWETWEFSAPLEGPKEIIEMGASGCRLGMLIYAIKEPMLHTWGRPVYYDGENVVAGESRPHVSDKIYVWGMKGIFTVGDHWTENCQDMPKLVLDDIPSEAELGAWNLAVESDNRVDIRGLKVSTSPVENIIWTASISTEATFTVGDLTEGKKYSIYIDGSKVSEEEANSRREVSFTSQGGVNMFSVVEVKAKFEFWALSVGKVTVGPGEPTAVTVGVMNTGGVEGTCAVELMVDGVTKTKEVTLGPRASGTVTFHVAESEAGTYLVSVDGLTKSFEVVEQAEPGGGGFPVVPVAAGVIVAVAAVAVFAYRRRR